MPFPPPTGIPFSPLTWTLLGQLFVTASALFSTSSSHLNAFLLLLLVHLGSLDPFSLRLTVVVSSTLGLDFRTLLTAGLSIDNTVTQFWLRLGKPNLATSTLSHLLLAASGNMFVLFVNQNLPSLISPLIPTLHHPVIIKLTSSIKPFLAFSIPPTHLSLTPLLLTPYFLPPLNTYALPTR